jgi:hypothetical protein
MTLYLINFLLLFVMAPANTAGADGTVTVAITGGGIGRVTSSPPGIDCGTVYFLNPTPGVCSASFPAGSAVILTVTAIGVNFSTIHFLNVFGEFSGACSGTDTTCSLSTSADAAVTARFDPAPSMVTVSVAGNAGGVVISDKGGLSCRTGTCTVSIPGTSGSIVTLTAMPDAGSSFEGWTGCAAPDGMTCMAGLNQFFSTTLTATFTTPAAADDSLRFAFLPSSRSMHLNLEAAFFATVLNTADVPLKNVAISAPSLSSTVSFQTTDPRTNASTGNLNTPVDIPAHGMQTFLITVRSNAVVAPTDVAFTVAGDTTATRSRAPGVDTVLFSASSLSTPIPDIIAVSATVSGDGIVDIPLTTGIAAFALATGNMGDPGKITVTTDTGPVSIPVTAIVCETDPATSRCLSAAGPSVTLQVERGTFHTFGVFVSAIERVAFLPERNRIFVRFKDESGAVRGATSVAVRAE